MTDNLGKVRRGRKYGIWTVGVVLLQIPVAILMNLLPDARIALELVAGVLSFAGAVTYALFLYGLVGIGMQENTRLAKTAKIAATLSLALGVMSLIGDILGGIILGAAILVFSLIFLVIFGVFSIKLAKDFTELEEKIGPVAKRAALWNKIAGWLMVSVILSPIGAILSIVADYFMWQSLGDYLRKNQSAA